MRREGIINLVPPSIMGVRAFYFIHPPPAGRALPRGGGVNIYTVLTSGILGIPGVAALYGIGLYKTL